MKNFINNIIYIKYYPNTKYKCNNNLLVIGFLRGIFKFKLFTYIYFTNVKQV